jgi:hypothetical protein
MILIRHINNTIANHETGPAREVEWTGATLKELAPTEASYCIVNGKRVDKDQWEYLIPNDGSCLTFVCVDSDPISTAIAVITIAAAGGLYSIGAITAWTFISISIMAGLQAGIANILYFLAPSGSSVPTFSGRRASPTYGFDRLQNQASNGASIPVVYGEHLVGGQIIMGYRRAIATGAHKFSQELTMLIALSEGPIYSVGIGENEYTTDQDGLTGSAMPSGMLINNIEASKFKDASLSLRMGTDSQTTMPGFEETLVEYGHEFYLSNTANDKQPFLPTTTNGSIFEWITRDPVNGIEIDTQCPNGLFRISKTTGKSRAISFETQLRITTLDGTVLFNQHFKTKANHRGAPLYATFRADLDWFSFTGSGAPQRVKVQFWRTDKESWRKKTTHSDLTALISVKEVLYPALSYPHLALIGLKVRATDQLSGTPPTVLTLMKGRTIDVWDGAIFNNQFSSNPAWIARDMLVSRRYGLGNLVEDIDPDTESFYEWAQEADAFIPKFTGADVADYALTGTTNANATRNITGIGTIFLSEVKVGEAIALDSDPAAYATVESIVSNTLLRVDAPLGDGSAQAIVVNRGLERRYRFDGVFDSARPGWEAVLSVTATSRVALLKQGNTIKAKIEKVKPALQLFTMGNIIRNSYALTRINPAERYNVIEAAFLNQYINYEQDIIVAETPDIDELGAEVRKSSISVYGITRPTHAKRLAFYFLRVERNTLKQLTFDVAVDSIAVEPGDVFLFSHDVPDFSESGRLAGTTGAPDDFAVLDRSLTFESGVIYRYAERNNADDSLLFKDFTHTGSTDTLPFQPLHGATDAQSRLWIIGRKLTLGQKFLCTKITSTNNGLVRKIEALQYVDDVYSDDSGPLPDTTFDAGELNTANPVENLAVVETSTTDGISTLTASWTRPQDGGGDDPNVARYAVYWRLNDEPIGQGGFYVKVGETPDADTLSFEFETDAAMGVTIRTAVQTINLDGSRNLPNDQAGQAPFFDLVLRREDDGTDLISFPAHVENIQFTQVDDTLYDLSWDAVTLDDEGNPLAIDGYEVRLGRFNDGVSLHTGAATSKGVRLNQLARRYNVRAFIDAPSGNRYYSPRNSFVLAPLEELSGYPSEVGSQEAEPEDGAAVNNGIWVHWYGGAALLQVLDELPVEYLSEPIDLGTSALTHVSMEVNVLPYIVAAVSETELFSGMRHIGFTGRINFDYLNWSAWLEHSANAVDWFQVNYHDRANTDITVNARYFRLRFRGNLAEIVADATEDLPAKVLVEKMALKLHRA